MVVIRSSLKQLSTCYPGFVSKSRKVFFHLDMNSLGMKTSVSESCKPFTVFVEGNIGSGKTTFLSYFNSRHVVVHSEPTDIWRNVRGHNVLQLMYQDPARWSFTFQSLVQKTMLELHVRNCVNHPVKLMERSIYSARYCFVENLYKEGLMSAPEYAVIDEWFKWIIMNMKIQGDLIVYLRTDPEVAYQRILDRGRKEESALTLDYLVKLNQLHEDWLVENKVFSTQIPVIVLDANRTIPEIIEEFQHHEAEIVEKISIKQKNVSASSSSSPSKIKHLLFGDPSQPNLINSTGL
ncbi:deoxynucleoside kinase-like [Lycorma delicatula]|uniref:deoxynucleoside kinase-like n=1 Tax=Lycorma delicatula TaxID=130591 RepID=UPI003F510451